eukprot:TRINITY_DN10584_c0_g1_i1.p1 TRINITY_DN10584_c0_g1~~TRINITY_DN10584_c0_g1_i1.p1  ORF type:complete len:323 (-),score=82.40 TRINITY_DN10584_c0_g1_i1:13-981(-)
MCIRDSWMAEAESEESEEESSELSEEAPSELEGPTPKSVRKKAPRSNVGCFRTGVQCPKCRAGWGEHLKSEGNEIMYSQFMRGAALVHCTRCLMEFGALTATHSCPHCSSNYEYFPKLYNKKVTCPAKKCGKKFGFLDVSATTERAREQLKVIEEDRRKREAKIEMASQRAERASRNTIEADTDAFTMKLGAFIVSEDCPVCSEIVANGHKAHLLKCLKAGPNLKQPKQRSVSKPAAARKKVAKPTVSKPKKPAAKKRKRACEWSDSGDDDYSDEELPKKKKAIPKAKGSKKARETVSYTHLRAHETVLDLVCRLLLEKKKK